MQTDISFHIYITGRIRHSALGLDTIQPRDPGWYPALWL